MLMKEKEKMLHFEQLVTKINIGKFTGRENVQRVIFLSSGIVIAHNNEIIFYNYKNYSKTLIMKIESEDKNYIKISKLLNDKFYVGTKNNSYIYQFNNRDSTISLLKKINVNLENLFELEENLFANYTNEYLYIWRKSKIRSIYRKNDIIFLIISFLIILCVNRFLKNFRFMLKFFIHVIIQYFYLCIIDKYTYLLNPYKRIKNKLVFYTEKCGNNICILECFDYMGIFNYKNYTIKKIISNDDYHYFKSFYILNENIIICCLTRDKRYKIYDIKQNKIINEFVGVFSLDYHNTNKIGNNIYITLDKVKNKNGIIKWKYNFELNKIDVLEKWNNAYSYDKLFGMTIKDNKLFIITINFTHNYDYKYIFLSIYK